MTNRSFQIAHELGRIYGLRASKKINLSTLDRLIAERELAITPKVWPGTNETDRKTARTVAMAADEPLRRLTFEREIIQNDLTVLDADLDALRAEQGAIEWSIRDETNRLMGGLSIYDQLQLDALEEKQEADASLQMALPEAEEEVTAAQLAEWAQMGEASEPEETTASADELPF